MLVLSFLISSFCYQTSGVSIDECIAEMNACIESKSKIIDEQEALSWCSGHYYD